jgi:hypothetical protein
MPQAVPFQLWMDLAPIASAVGVSGTVTVTTTSSHGITPGAYVQIDGLTDAGTAFNTVAQVATTPSGTTFTYVVGASSGTATVDAGVISYDLLNPPINYASGTARQHALIAEPGQLQLSANGDGSGSSMSLTVLQETTPAVGPWFNLIPDNTRFRLTQKDTGSVPGTADVRFLGLLSQLNSELTGSGQGTFTTVTLGDVNVLMDRLGVFGQNNAIRTLRGDAATRNSNVTTLNFGAISHGFSVGQTIKVSGFAGGGTGSFNGIFTVASTPTTKTLTYANTGTSCTSGFGTGGSPISVAVSRKGRSSDRIVIKSTGSPGSTVNYLNIESGDTVFTNNITFLTSGSWTNPQDVRLKCNGTFSGSQVIKVNAYTIEIILSSPIAGTWGNFGPGAICTGKAPQAGPPIVNGQMIVKIAKGATEDTAVKNFLALTNSYKSGDYPLQRLFNTSGTAQISGGTTYVSNQDVQFGATTLRSAMDAIIETYTGNDIKDRRTFIDVNGNLNYKLVDAEAKPTYATAPYSIITTGAGDPNTNTAKATVAPFNLAVTWDHETAKAAMFTIPASSGAALTQVWAYTDLSTLTTGGSAAKVFTERKGAPMLDAVVDFPTAVTNPGAQIQGAAAAYFAERHSPLLSGSFELRGAGTAAWNEYGFASGYAQTGASTFELVEGWKPGQWVEVEAAGLGLTGLYRVEQVDWALEPGSYIQRVTITFNRKNPSDLATIVAGQKR